MSNKMYVELAGVKNVTLNTYFQMHFSNFTHN